MVLELLCTILTYPSIEVPIKLIPKGGVKTEQTANWLVILPPKLWCKNFWIFLLAVFILSDCCIFSDKTCLCCNKQPHISKKKSKAVLCVCTLNVPERQTQDNNMNTSHYLKNEILTVYWFTLADIIAAVLQRSCSVHQLVPEQQGTAKDDHPGWQGNVASSTALCSPCWRPLVTTALLLLV